MNLRELGSLSPKELITIGYACALDFRAFIATCLYDQLNYPFGEFHDYCASLINHRLRGKLRIAIAAPRGQGKSTLVTEAGVLWLLLRNEYLNLNPRDPANKRYICIISDTTDQAIERLSNIKSMLIDNDAIRILFPKFSGEGKIWKTDYIITNGNIAVRALGTGSKIRGRRFGYERINLAICDDIENLEIVQSNSLRQQLFEWFTKDLLHAVDPDKGDVVVVGTILSKKSLLYNLLHEDDFAAWEGVIFKTVKKWPKRMDLWDRFGEILKDRTNKKRKEEAIAFYERHKEEMDEEAEILWPQRYTLLDVMMDYYLSGRSAFLTEKQNEIIEEHERIFNITQYKFYDEDEFLNIPQGRLLYYMYIDPATGKRKGRTRKQSTDMFAVVVIAKDLKTGIYYVVEAYGDIITPDRQFRIIKHLLKQYPIFRLYVESNTSQYYYYESLRDWLRNQGIYKPMPRQHINKQNKESRIEALVPYLENWTIRLNPNHRKLLRQLEEFPNCEYDDIIDCMSSCFFVSHKSFKPVYA